MARINKSEPTHYDSEAYQYNLEIGTTYSIIMIIIIQIIKKMLSMSQTSQSAVQLKIHRLLRNINVDRAAKKTAKQEIKFTIHNWFTCNTKGEFLNGLKKIHKYPLIWLLPVAHSVIREQILWITNFNKILIITTLMGQRGSYEWRPVAQLEELLADMKIRPFFDTLRYRELYK